MGGNLVRTTHVGSLPRPDALIQTLRARHEGGEFAAELFETQCDEAVAECVAKQKECGVDIVSDGEMSKISYAYYVKERLDGMESPDAAQARGEHIVYFQKLDTAYPEFPDFSAYRAKANFGPASVRPPICTGPLKYRNLDAVETDLKRLERAADQARVSSCFMPAASPGVIAMFSGASSYYRNEDDYVFALAEAMRPEYEAIARAGVVLQLDAPDLPLARAMKYSGGDVDPMRIVSRNIEAINQATANIPAERIRVHLCWGNYSGPHIRDIAVSKLFDSLRKLRPRLWSFEAANPRHEHEWADWRDAKFDDDVILIPGVIDSVSNFVEHPRLIAERISRFTSFVGRDRVIAGSDCGFGTFATGFSQTFPSIVWAKLKALREGADIASAA